MICVKTERELEIMRRACKITAAARALAGEMVRPGVTTGEIDKAVHDFIVSQGAKPSFLHYQGYPASACISVNEVVIHGIPGSRVLKEGDIVSVDVGAYWQGFHGDCAATFACGNISQEAQRLIDVTKQSFFEGIRYARQGYRVSDISHAVQTYVEANGFSVVRAFVGHGVGEHLHEEPSVPNYGAPGKGPRLVKNMTIAVEPMVNMGTYDVRVLRDGWTTVTADGKLAAHYENSILITDGEAEILTVTEGLSFGRNIHIGHYCLISRTRSGKTVLCDRNRRRVRPDRQRKRQKARTPETEKAEACSFRHSDRLPGRRQAADGGKGTQQRIEKGSGRPAAGPVPEPRGG